MNQPDDKANTPDSTPDNTNGFELEPHKRRLALALSWVAVAIVLALIFWSVREYHIRYPEDELWIGYGRPGFESLGLIAVILLFSSYLIQVIAVPISKLYDRQSEKIAYVFLSFGILLTSSSLVLLFISHSPEHKWLGYISMVVVSFGITTFNLTQLIPAHKKRLATLFQLVALALVLVAPGVLRMDILDITSSLLILATFAVGMIPSSALAATNKVLISTILFGLTLAVLTVWGVTVGS